MRYRHIYIMFFIMLFSANACAEERRIGNVRIPPGMETIKTGNNYIIVPKGGRVRSDGNVLIVESPDAYAARNFEDMQAVINKMKEEMNAMKKEIKELQDRQNKAR